MAYGNFIIKYRNPFARELKRKHTAAYLILDTIAENAKRCESSTFIVHHPLLELGEAIITAEACGITSQRSSTGLNYLESIGFIKIIHRGRNDKNSLLLARVKTKSTQIPLQFTAQINGTVAKLLDSSIFDINMVDDTNQYTNQTPINSGSKTDKQEVKKYNKIKKEHIDTPPPEKINFRDYVSLSQNEYDKLLEKHGLKILDEMLNILNSYKGGFGKSYKSDYHIFSDGGWVLRALKEQSQKPQLTTIRDRIMQNFKNGNFYNNAECFINDESIAFVRGHKHEQLKFKEKGFLDQFDNILRKFDITNPFLQKQE